MRYRTLKILLNLLVVGTTLGLSCSKITMSRFIGTDSPSDPEKPSSPPPVDDLESVSPPVNIAGSYLVCARTRNADPKPNEATALCALQDDVTKQKVDITTRFTKYVWLPEVPALSSVTSRSRELVGDPLWHLELIITAESAPLLDQALQGTRVTLKVRDQDSLLKQAVASVSVYCTGLAGGTWVQVPGDAVYGTADFCLQKYVATEVKGVPTSQTLVAPWVNVSQNAAITACSGLGDGYHLITNPEWMTVAANLANVGANWSAGAVGSGSMRRGNSGGHAGVSCQASGSDTEAYVEAGCVAANSGEFIERRTSILSNGSVVWDIGGNLWQWIDYFNDSDKPADTGATEYPDLTDSSKTPKSHLVPLNSAQSWWNDAWNSSQGIGRYLSSANGLEGELARGGDGGDIVNAGPFAASLDAYMSAGNSDRIGFRCVWKP